MLGAIDYFLHDLSKGVARIQQGQVPSGSGDPLPIGNSLALNDYLFLPGRSGGQTITGVDASDAVVITTPTASGGFLKFTPPSFTVANCTTNGTSTLTTSGSGFLPNGGPGVVQGMLVTGADIPANTYIQSINAGNNITLTNLATGSHSGLTVTFQPSVEIISIQDETGADVHWLSRGAVRFTPGTANYPLRIVGDTKAWASGIGADGIVYLEVGREVTGSAVGAALQIGGPQHGELVHLNLLTNTLWLSRNPLISAAINVGIGALDPATFGTVGSGLGPAVDLLVARSANATGVAIVAAGTSTNAALIVQPKPSTSVTGTSPTQTLSTTAFWFKVSEDGRVWIANGTGTSHGAYLTANATVFSVTFGDSGKVIIVGSEDIVSWSDAVHSSSIYFGDTTSAGLGNVWLSSAGNAVYNRFGVGSVYTLLTNAQAGGASFLAPSATPEVVQIVNSSDGGTGGANGCVLLSLRTKRSGQTGAFLEARDSGGTVLAGIAADGSLKFKTTEKVDATNQNLDITTTTLSSVAGFYNVVAVLECTTSDGAAGSVVLTVSWTDDVGAATGTATQVLTGTGRVTLDQQLYMASGNLTYAITHTGSYGTAKYALRLRTIPLG